jgi:adenylate cyclase
VRAEALRLGAVDVIDKPSGAVSRDLQKTRGRIIQQTLRRVLGLPAVHVSDQTLPPDGASATASILSVWLKDFASLCERVEAKVLVGLLNEHLALVDGATRKHRGIIDGHVGSATLAAFGVPLARTDHASRAVAAGTELLDAQAALGAERRGAGAPLLEIGVAIVTDFALAGDFGPPDAQRYRTMGPAIDHAARLGRSTEDYGVDLVVCGRTLAALAATPPSRRLDVVQLEPEGEPIALHEVLSIGSDSHAGAADAYARGMEHYEIGQFANAIYAFDEALRRRPSDRAATRLLSRCRALLRTPSSEWHGVWPFDGVRG